MGKIKPWKIALFFWNLIPPWVPGAASQWAGFHSRAPCSPPRSQQGRASGSRTAHVPWADKWKGEQWLVFVTNHASFWNERGMVKATSSASCLCIYWHLRKIKSVNSWYLWYLRRTWGRNTKQRLRLPFCTHQHFICTCQERGFNSPSPNNVKYAWFPPWTNLCNRSMHSNFNSYFCYLKVCHHEKA